MSLKIKISLAISILLFPMIVIAHTGAPHLEVEAGVVPGSWKYGWERLAEWLEVNIFTISTRAKQQANLILAEERLAELAELVQTRDQAQKNLDLVVSRYQYFLGQARDMAEKIIFLDGAQISLADRFQERTRIHEFLINQTLTNLSGRNYVAVAQALEIAHAENMEILRFMVEHYQLSDADIRKHQIILQQHIVFLENRFQDLKAKFNDQESKKIAKDLEAADKFKQSGLNREALQQIERVSLKIYSKL